MRETRRIDLLVLAICCAAEAAADDHDAGSGAGPSVPPAAATPIVIDQHDYTRCIIPLPARTFLASAIPPRVAVASEPPVVAATASPPALENRPQVQLDLGLAVVGVAFEHHLGEHFSIQLGGQLFSTYFAPWFDAGDKVLGVGGSLRPTYFVSPGGRGIYIAPFVRVARVTGEAETGETGSGVGFSTGMWAGYAFGLSKRLDLRVGAGLQYMRYFVDTSAGRVGLSTPFVGLDLVVGYRL
jgi:hypothetical protein